ncbi:MAG: sugar phosphate isomerase/epimerase [Bryobacterales bacterium]|nr:sugar phosphate isomerase/epimerase [Bryobacteraceae bacterium]MDW8354042.1 sugar phosphate isomerase/epimerase [Bryobacterales bacterium]
MQSVSSRRTFLKMPAALAASGPLAALAAAAEAEDLKLGVATYSLRKFPRARAIEMIKELGVRYVSIKSFHLPYELPPAELAAGAKEFRDAGLTVLSGGNIDLKNPAELRRMFEYAKAAGMPMIVCAPSHETLPEVEKLVKEYDIRAAIHNHGPEDKYFPTPKSVLDAVHGRDPRLGLCIDIGHTARTGADILESIREAGARLFDVHVKDLKDTSARAVQVAVGDGVLPIVGMLRLLKKMNYQGGVMLEYEIYPDNPLPGMHRSIGYMRGVLAGMRG